MPVCKKTIWNQLKITHHTTGGCLNLSNARSPRLQVVDIEKLQCNSSADSPTSPFELCGSRSQDNCWRWRMEASNIAAISVFAVSLRQQFPTAAFLPQQSSHHDGSTTFQIPTVASYNDNIVFRRQRYRSYQSAIPTELSARSACEAQTSPREKETDSDTRYCKSASPLERQFSSAEL